MSSYKFERIDKNDCALLVIDHQVGLYHIVRDFTPIEMRNNILAHAAMAKVFNLPVVLTTSAEVGMSVNPTSPNYSSSSLGPNRPLPKEIIDMHPNAPLIKRNGEVNAWDNPEFRAAVEATGKKQLILGSIATDVSFFLSYLDMHLTIYRSAHFSWHYPFVRPGTPFSPTLMPPVLSM